MSFITTYTLERWEAPRGSEANLRAIAQKSPNLLEDVGVQPYTCPSKAAYIAAHPIEGSASPLAGGEQSGGPVSCSMTRPSSG